MRQLPNNKAVVDSRYVITVAFCVYKLQFNIELRYGVFMCNCRKTFIKTCEFSFF